MDEIDNSEKCPFCKTRNEEDITEINGHFTTDTDVYSREIHLYFCRNCSAVYGSDY